MPIESLTDQREADWRGIVEESEPRRRGKSEAIEAQKPRSEED